MKASTLPAVEYQRRVQTERKLEGGSHNRKARRAAKAKGKPLPAAAPSEAQRLREMWEAFGRHQSRRVVPPFDELQYLEEHGYLDPWPPHIPLQPCVARLLEVAPAYEKLSPAAFSAEGQRLADILAADGSEHLGCDTGKLSKRDAAQKAEHVRALGEALALGSCVPGGIKIFGMWFETKDGHTACRILMHAGEGNGSEGP